MSASLFAAIRVDYDKARARHGMAVTREARPSTIEKNRVAEEAAYNAVVQQLEQWNANGALRELITAGNSDIAKAVKLLTEAAALAATRHHEIVAKLEAMQNSMLASSSSSTHMADVEMQGSLNPSGSSADVIMQEPVTSDACIICMSESPDGPAMPCCFQGNHRACKDCYMELFSRSDELKCPSCRTAFKDSVPVGDVAAFSRFSAFMCGLFPTHDKVIEALVNSRSEPRKLVLLKHLAAFNTPAGPKPLMDIDDMLVEANRSLDSVDGIVEVQILHDTRFLKAPSKWARFRISEESIVGNPDDIYQVMPLQYLSAPGDDIHAFVQRACKGVWFHHMDLIEVRVFNCAYPLYYDFDEYKRIQGRETVMLLQVYTECGTLIDPVEIPLSAIETCKNHPHGHRLFNSQGHHDLPKHVALRLYGERWQQCWVKELMSGGYGSRLVIAAYPGSPFTRTIYNSSVEEHELLKPMFLGDSINIVGMPEDIPDHPVVRVVCSHLCPEDTRNRISPNESFLFLGYTEKYLSPDRPRVLYLLIARDDGWGHKVSLEKDWVAIMIYERSI